MEDLLVDNCQRLFDRNQEQLRECLTNTTNVYHDGLEDLSQSSHLLLKNHREDINRMFSINRQASGSETLTGLSFHMFIDYCFPPTWHA